ncbi:putative Calcium channel flower [Polypedilum vanderplanki]|uniref:Calcium channel flower n=1 Tax=Polypedilum vanderplanki TaxID=319348 RepID=A0A9J6CKZ2_POLVA|nr:putative Calcium channel flower [Polypedilum vanderplanki]
MDKVIGLLSKANPNQANQPDDGTPWYLKYGAKALGIIGAFFCVLFGLFGLLTLSMFCLISTIIQILVGLVVIAVEAPFCCMFIDHVQTIATKIDERPHWNRAAVYCILAIFPVVLCPELGSIFPCALVFGCGVLYGMMALGKKGTREDMAAVASPTSQMPTNDQHNILIEDPDVWRS